MLPEAECILKRAQAERGNLTFAMLGSGTRRYTILPHMPQFRVPLSRPFRSLVHRYKEGNTPQKAQIKNAKDPSQKCPHTDFDSSKGIKGFTC